MQNIALFQKKFEEIVNRTIHPEQLVPVVEIDTELDLSEVDDKLLRILQQFQPFGPENMAPVFFTENVADNGDGKVVGATGEHLKLYLIQEEDPYKVYPAIAFQQGHNFPAISQGHAFDICYSIEENEFRGETNLQLNIKDIKTD